MLLFGLLISSCIVMSDFSLSRLLFSAVFCLSAVHASAENSSAVNPVNSEMLQFSRKILEAQRNEIQILSKAISGKRVWYAGFAMDSRSSAFRGDIELVKRGLQQVRPDLLSFRLSNDVPGTTMSVPLAVLPHLERISSDLAALSKPEDVLIVVLSSHGLPNLLSVNIANKDYGPVLAHYLKANFDRFDKTPTLIIISSCFSGSMIPQLKSPNRIILTASAADKVSWGCQPLAENTFFIDALFKAAFDPALPLTQIFEKTRLAVARKEEIQQLQPSNPQMYVGENMKRIADLPLQLWLKNSALP